MAASSRRLDEPAVHLGQSIAGWNGALPNWLLRLLHWNPGELVPVLCAASVVCGALRATIPGANRSCGGNHSLADSRNAATSGVCAPIGAGLECVHALGG